MRGRKTKFSLAFVQARLHGQSKNRESDNSGDKFEKRPERKHSEKYHQVSGNEETNRKPEQAHLRKKTWYGIQKRGGRWIRVTLNKCTKRRY
jgi:hypothetical protein